MRKVRELLEQSRRLIADHGAVVREYERIKAEIDALDRKAGAPRRKLP
jgi:hypothetical protein